METEKAGRRELESTLEAFQSRARDAEGLAKDTARDGEEIMKALYGQVDDANKVRCAVPASRWFCFVLFLFLFGLHGYGRYVWRGMGCGTWCG